MTRRLGRAAVRIATVLPVALALACAGSSSSASPSPPDLSGTWLLNPAESETFQERAGPGARPGAVTPEDRERMRQQVEIGIRAFRAFKLEQNDSTVTLTSAEGPMRVFYTDGRRLERRIEGLGNVTVSARWDGHKLKVRRALADGVAIEETYERSDDGRRLLVRFRVTGGARGLDFRRVYETVSLD